MTLLKSGLQKNPQPLSTCCYALPRSVDRNRGIVFDSDMSTSPPICRPQHKGWPTNAENLRSSQSESSGNLMLSYLLRRKPFLAVSPVRWLRQEGGQDQRASALGGNRQTRQEQKSPKEWIGSSLSSGLFVASALLFVQRKIIAIGFFVRLPPLRLVGDSLSNDTVDIHVLPDCWTTLVINVS